MTTLLTLSQIASTSAERAGQAQVFSDLHKDALGFRPRDRACLFTSVEDFDQTWEYLLKELAATNEAEAAAERMAIERFQERVEEVMSMVVGSTKEDAIRIMVDADGHSDDYNYKDYDYIDYCWGLPYGHLRAFLGA